MLPFYMLYIHFIRDIDDAVIRLLPQAKMLSEPTALPHLVQLLLTFDPSLVDKVVTLLNNIPYGKKISRPKTFTNFVNRWQFSKLLFA